MRSNLKQINLSAKPLLLLALTALIAIGRAEASSKKHQIQAKPDRSADLVLLDGNVCTMDASRTWASAIAIKDGKILYVGNDASANAFVGPNTSVQELSGRLVLPGFHDSHVHLTDGGIALAECALDSASSRAETLKIIEKYVLEHPNEPWIIGAGWSLPFFPNACPTRQELDAVTGQRPAVFFSQDYHSAWLNSAALVAANITKETREPAHGRIEREPDSHEPIGTLREDAIELVKHAMPERTDAQRLEGLERAVHLANRFGITAVQDADADAKILNAYLALQRLGKLSLNVVAALHTEPERGTKQVAQLARMREKFSQGRVHANMVKLFADGVIEAHTASLMEPYTDRSSERGLPNFTHDDLVKIVEALALAKFRIHVHAIGDQAVHDALDAFESAHSPNLDLRHEIAHLELIAPQDIGRFRRLGVIADCQPFWAFNDPYITQCTLPLVGPERSNRLYQFQSLYSTGTTVACGSDWPVTTLNPLDAIEVAVTRQSIEKDKHAPLIPEERMALPDVIAAYTINGAFAADAETHNGSIENGKDADVIVLDKNIFAIPPSEIHNAKVVLTLLEGTEVFRDESFPQQDVAQDNRSLGGNLATTYESNPPK